VKERTGQPLGAVLIELGLAKEADVLEVLGAQLRIAVREVDPYAVPDEVLRRLPAEVARRLGVLPIEERGGRLVVATDRLLQRAEIEEIERAVGGPVELTLATRSEVAFALRRRYGHGAADGTDSGSRDTDGAPRLGEHLVAAGALTRTQLEEALQAQRRSYRRLGDIVVELGWLDRTRMEEAAAAARARTRALGAELLERGWVTPEQLDDALRRQAQSNRRLGDLLLERNMLSRETLDDALESLSLQ